MPKSKYQAKRKTQRTVKRNAKRALKTEARRSHSKEVPRNNRIPVGKSDSKVASGLQVLVNRLNRMNFGRVA